MTSLQDRLDKAFGALGGGAEPAWQPSRQQVFRSGPIDAAGGNSSDEDAEYEERQRRETVPGLAQALVEEDNPDAEGFRPSTAFCRALDAEDEYDLTDEMATGLIARRGGGDALPPLSTQVLEDNIYEQRARQQAAVAAAAAAAATAPGSDAAEQQPSSMDVEEEPSALPPAGPAAPAASGQQAEQEHAGAGPAASPAKQKKKVRFEGIAPSWVPPHLRPGYQPRCTELPPGEEGEEGAQRQQQWRLPRPPRRRHDAQQSASVVPEHVKHPEKFTCYVLDEPLVVGGGVGQLSGESQQQDMPAAAAAAAAGGQAPEAEQAQQAAPEPERWQGPVGKGAVQFKPKPRQQLSEADAAANPSGKPAPQGRQQHLHLDFEDSAEGGAEGEGGAAVAAPGSTDVPMQESGAVQPTSARSKRHYRSSRVVNDNDD